MNDPVVLIAFIVQGSNCIEDILIYFLFFALILGMLHSILLIPSCTNIISLFKRLIKYS